MFKKILLAVDLNETHDRQRVAEAALLLAGPTKADLHIVNVVPDSGMAIVGAALGPDHDKQIVAEARRELTAFAAEIAPGLPDSSLHVVKGTIYDRIIKLAGTIGADVIVVGAHRPDLRDYLVGPNAARVVRHATQSVFVVR
ncbi:MAG: universal stress protein [Marinibacterium sp.]